MAIINAKLKFSPRIVDHLGISAYNSVNKCLSELVVNAYDADASIVDITLPDTMDENAYIEIADDGFGMSPEDLRDKFLLVGRNRRDDGQTTPKGRLVIGSKGIGKLAGFGIASRIELISNKDHVQSHLRIDRKELEEFATVGEKEMIINSSPTELGNGSKLQLHGLHSGVHLPESDDIRRHLFRVLPTKTDFKVRVNGVDCTAEDVPGVKSDFNENIVDIGNVVGFYIIANSRQKQPGLSVRVRGRLVQEPSLFGLDTRSHGFFTAEKIVGEINAEFLDPTGADGGTIDLIKTSRDGFLEDSPIVRSFNAWAAEFVKKIVQGIDATETQKRTDSLLSAPVIMSRLEKLPPHIRGTATKVARTVIGKLKTASDAEAQDLVEWILKYYESNVLKELMKSILSADITEAEKLAELVREWGLSQVNSIVGLIRTQIDIIQKLEELIISDKAHEIELHKLIEANLWLVREGLELWSSDKPLKTVLEGRIIEIYKGQEDLRPDLICKSRNDGNDAVIMEFKRPKETIKSKHVTQAMEYEGLLKKHRPNIHFETYVVGREYDADVLAMQEKLGKASLYFWSFEEILQKSRMRFEKILEILGQ